MIDIENELFSIISAVVRAAYPSIYMTGEFIRQPPSFPCVTLIEMSNTVYQKSQSTYFNENHVSVMYELNVYSNKTSGKKTECKSIAALIDEELLELGFTRTMLSSVPNLDDATIYRITGRYSAVIDKNEVIYRR